MATKWEGHPQIRKNQLTRKRCETCGIPVEIGEDCFRISPPHPTNGGGVIHAACVEG